MARFDFDKQQNGKRTEIASEKSSRILHEAHEK
jgi:hypothetical protein